MSEAEKDAFREVTVGSLRQGIPDDLDWLPLGEAPTQRWRDDGSDVDGVIVRGWLVEAVRRESPEPDESFRRYSELLSPDTSAHLAGWVLDRWIGHDTAQPPALTDARRGQLRTLAEQAAELSRRFGRPGGDPEERYQQLLEQEANWQPTSGLPYCGLLSIVASCGGEALIDDVAHYVASWHADRSEQCACLLRAASWIGGRAATELLGMAASYPETAEVAEKSLAARNQRTASDA